MRTLRAWLASLLFQVGRLAGRLPLDGDRPIRAAMALYSNAIRVDQQVASGCHLRLGVLLARSGQSSRAAQVLARATRVHPEQAILHFQLGHASMACARYREAMDAFVAAVRIDPDHAIYWQDLEFAVGRAEAEDDHLDTARSLAADRPRHWLVRRHLGSVLARLDRFAESTAEYRDASRARWRKRHPTEAPGRIDVDRSVPDILLIGASRCGKSTLYRHLVNSPAVEPALYEEINYLVDGRDPGVSWYESQFPPIPAGDPRRTIHSGTPYLHHPDAPWRVADGCPSARVVLVLRNPVLRAHAHYYQGRSLGKIDRSWSEVVTEWLGAYADVPADELRDVCGRGYIADGVYLPGVRRWVESLPADRLLIVQSEHLFERPSDALRQVSTFLGLPEVPVISEPPAPRLDRFDTTIDPATRRALEDYYRPHNDALERYLGRRFGW